MKAEGGEGGLLFGINFHIIAARVSLFKMNFSNCLGV